MSVSKFYESTVITIVGVIAIVLSDIKNSYPFLILDRTLLALGPPESTIIRRTIKRDVFFRCFTQRNPRELDRSSPKTAPYAESDCNGNEEQDQNGGTSIVVR